MWDVRAVSTPLTSEVPHLQNQTGPTTDTYGVIWHIHFTQPTVSSSRKRRKMIPIKLFQWVLISYTFFQAAKDGRLCSFMNVFYMYMPKSDAEKVTVKGSHGESSLQRESDSFGFYNRTVSQQGTAVWSTPRGPTKTKKTQ